VGLGGEREGRGRAPERVRGVGYFCARFFFHGKGLLNGYFPRISGGRGRWGVGTRF
jgi:hypothetical protein